MRIRHIGSTAEAYELADELRASAGSVAARGASAVEQAVADIIRDVERTGDEALLRLESELDACDLSAVGLEVSRTEISTTASTVPHELRRALRIAADQLKAFHEASMAVLGDEYTFSRGGIRIRSVAIPVRRVGIYVPGGRAAYPSTLLMTAIPAKAAGVPEVFVCVPPLPDGSIPAQIAAAAEVAGVERIFRIGGAQAIVAMAYGTSSVPKADIVVGPGNVYVAAAKRAVFGRVGIDSIAGPSELALVLGDGGDVGLAALDLVVQAEHGPGGVTAAVVLSDRLAQELLRHVEEELAADGRSELREFLEKGGCVAVCAELEIAEALVEALAPEHLQVDLGDDEASLRFALGVRSAGAVFVGRGMPVAYGDYVAGPSHVLPTGGAARFSSVLSVETFLLRRNVILSEEGGVDPLLQSAGETLAAAEGMRVHLRSMQARRASDPATRSIRETE